MIAKILRSAIGSTLIALSVLTTCSASENFYEMNGAVRLADKTIMIGGLIEPGSGRLIINKSFGGLSELPSVQAGLIIEGQDASIGPFGTGTSSPVDWVVTGATTIEPGYYTVIGPGNRHYRFAARDGAGNYIDSNDVSMLGAKLIFSVPSGDYCKLVWKNQSIWYFTCPNGDGNAALSEIRDCHGNDYTISRNSTNGFPIQIPANNSSRYIRYWYDGGSPVVTRIEVKYSSSGTDRIWSLAYDANHREITSITDPQGHVTHYGWTSYQEYQSNNILPLIQTITDPLGNQTLSFVYDNLGRVTTVHRINESDMRLYYWATFPGQNVGTLIGTSYYSSETLVETGFNAIACWTQWQPYNDGCILTDRYDFNDNTSVADCWTHYAYGVWPVLLVTSITDPQNRTVSFGFDTTTGNLLSMTEPTASGGSVTEHWTYDPAYNEETSFTNANGQTYTHTINATTGNVDQTSDPNGATTRYTYNGAGDCLTITDAIGNKTTLGYDSNRRVVSLTDPLNEVWSAARDDTGWSTSTTDSVGHIVTFSRDLLGRLTGSSETIGGVVSSTAYVYDANGNRVSTTDRNGNVWTATYDPGGRPLSATNPLNKTCFWSYDSEGSLIQYQDALGQKLRVVYGNVGNYGPDYVPLELDRLNTDGSLASKVTYTYDQTTALLNGYTDTASGSSSWTLDALSRPTSVSTSQGGYTLGYNDYGQLVSLTVSGQPAVSYGYNNLGQVNQVSQGGVSSSFAYDANGRLIQQNLGNGVVTCRELDALGRPTEVVSMFGSVNNSAFDGTHYTYTVKGPVATANANGVTTTYQYDTGGRPTSASDGTNSYSWTYDKAGNLLTQTLNGAQTAYGYNAASQMISAGGVALARDANGNVTSYNGSTYSYDPQGRLASMSGSGGSASFLYGPNNDLVSQTVSGMTTSLLNASGRPVQENTGGTAVNTVYGPAFGTPLERGGLWFSANGDGSATALTNGAQQIVETYKYSPLGVATAVGGVTNPDQWHGWMSTGTGIDVRGGIAYMPSAGTTFNLASYPNGDIEGEYGGYGGGMDLPVPAEMAEGIAEAKAQSRIVPETIVPLGQKGPVQIAPSDRLIAQRWVDTLKAQGDGEIHNAYGLFHPMVGLDPATGRFSASSGFAAATGSGHDPEYLPFPGEMGGAPLTYEYPGLSGIHNPYVRIALSMDMADVLNFNLEGTSIIRLEDPIGYPNDYTGMEYRRIMANDELYAKTRFFGIPEWMPNPEGAAGDASGTDPRITGATINPDGSVTTW